MVTGAAAARWRALRRRTGRVVVLDPVKLRRRPRHVPSRGVDGMAQGGPWQHHPMLRRGN